MNSCGTTSADRRLVADFVSRCRRRWHAVVFARTFLGALGVSLPAAAAWTVAINAMDSPRAVVTAIAAAAIAAGVATAAQRPTVRLVGEAIDRQLALQGRVTTALELSGQSDAFSMLVAADAARHLRAVQPRQVYRFAIGERPFPAALAILGATVVIGFVGMGDSPLHDAPRLATSATSGGAVRPVSAAAAEVDAGKGETDNSVRAAGEAVPTKASSATERADRPQAQSDAAATQSADAPGERNGLDTRRSADSDTPRSAIPQQRLVNAGSSGTAVAGTGTATGEARARIAAEAAAPPGAAATLGSARSDGTGSDLAGGVDLTAAALHGDVLPAPTQIRTNRSAAATLAEAKVHAEAALRRDDIAPSMRDVVRRYFFELQRRAVR